MKFETQVHNSTSYTKILKPEVLSEIKLAAAAIFAKPIGSLNSAIYQPIVMKFDLEVENLTF
jgi:hypothetical protein